MFRFLKSKRPTTRRHPPHRDRARLGVESLDRRDLPSATANLVLSTGALTITGNDQGSQVTVSEDTVVPYAGAPTNLNLQGVSSVTINGSPYGGAIPSYLVRSLNVNLGNGDDTLTVRRNLLVYAADRGQWWTNPFYGSLQSITVHAGSGNDRIDLSASPAPAQVFGESGSDTIYGGSGNDTLVGGGQGDYLYGNGGNDVLYGAEMVAHGYTDDWNYMDGGAGNDSLYGGNGGNTEFGGDGNDALYGGTGGSVSWLYGGNGADRFLVRDERYNSIWYYSLDAVMDRAAEDAVVHFRCSFDWPTLTAHTWSDSEIQDVMDPALGKLVARTNNTRLLKLSNGGELTFQRFGSLGTIGSTGLTEAGDNNSQGLIRIADPTFSAGSGPAMTVVIHELGHNWDESSENPIVGQFRSLSGWTAYPLWLIGKLPGDTVSGDGQWQYVTGTPFLRTYSQYNPYEDFADSFEATIDGTAGTIAAKANVINSWLDSIRS